MQDKNLTLVTLIISGLFAILGTVGGGMIKGYWDVELARQKFQSDLVLKALESNVGEERLSTLQMLVSTNLIKDSDISEGVSKYVEANLKEPSKIPQIKSASNQALEPPTVDNARIYLLADNKRQTDTFESLKHDLAVAGFSVVGARTIVDETRTDLPEVRYFTEVDKSQAEKLATFVKARTLNQKFTANKHLDPKVKPGYFEIWMGR